MGNKVGVTVDQKFIAGTAQITNSMFVPFDAMREARERRIKAVELLLKQETKKLLKSLEDATR